MSFFCDSYPIVDKKALGEGIYSYTLKCPEVAENAHIGQFVQIKAEGYMLRRPISICSVDKENGTMRLVFEVRGKGTDKISELNKGDLMDVIAPLGNGFTVPAKKDGRVIVVGGGIGTPPLLDIAKMYGDRCTAILGFRSFDKVILDKDYSLAGANVIVCTDDGSTGVHGTIAQPLADELAKAVDKITADTYNIKSGARPAITAVSKFIDSKLLSHFSRMAKTYRPNQN